MEQQHAGFSQAEYSTRPETEQIQPWTKHSYQTSKDFNCPLNGDASTRVDLDFGSGNTFDTSFFNNLSRGRGILQSDHLLWTNPTTRTIVQEFMASRDSFNAQFARSMVKMSNIGVKTGVNGEIRRVCSTVN